ncbi:hypothetical protein LEMLEM_LOCUS12234 [Lemmus lemmus]
MTSRILAISEDQICDCKPNSSFSDVLGLDSIPRKQACGKSRSEQKSLPFI